MDHKKLTWLLVTLNLCFGLNNSLFTSVQSDENIVGNTEILNCTKVFLIWTNSCNPIKFYNILVRKPREMLHHENFTTDNSFSVIGNLTLVDNATMESTVLMKNLSLLENSNYANGTLLENSKYPNETLPENSNYPIGTLLENDANLTLVESSTLFKNLTLDYNFQELSSINLSLANEENILLANLSGNVTVAPETEEEILEQIIEFIFPRSWTWVLITCHALVFFVGLVGNTLVCVSVYRNHSMRTVTNYFIVNLAIADFLVILLCLPPTVIWDVTMTWFFGVSMCKITLYLQVSLLFNMLYA